MSLRRGERKSLRREGKEQREGSDICSLCEDDRAITYCRTCSVPMCFDCQNSHKKQRRSRGHDVIAYVHVEATSEYATCLFHSGNDMTNFCETCKTVCCGVCVTEKHNAHNTEDISEYIEQIKQLCWDKTKYLQDQCQLMVTQKNNSGTARENKKKQYEEVKRNIQEQKRLSVDLIRKIADKEIGEVTKAQAEIDTEFEGVGSAMHESIKRCEQAVAPVMSVMMGADTGPVVRFLQQLEIESENVQRVKKDTEELHGRRDIQTITFGNSLAEIQNLVQTVLGTEDEGSNQLEVNIGEKQKRYVEKQVEQKSQQVVQTAQQDIHKAKLLDETALSDNECLSRRAHKGRIVSQNNESISLLEYKDTCKLVRSKTAIFPEARQPYGQCLLMIDDSRYIIISDDEISLCGAADVLRYVEHSEDGYVPDAIAYVNNDTFVSLCCKQKKIRYHNTETLGCISTHDLQWEEDDVKYDSRFILYTADSNIIVNALHGDSMKLLQFEGNGVLINVVTLPEALCGYPNTVCLARENQILIATNDGSIYKISLEGNHTMIGKISGDVQEVWGAAVDEDFMYVTYSASREHTTWICKLKLQLAYPANTTGCGHVVTT